MPGIQNSKAVLEYLNGLGSNDRGDDLQLSHTAQALVELADFLITTARENMDKGGNTATGGTASSMVAGPLQTNANKLEIDISLASTYKFLNDGVKGWESGQGKYQFKRTRPSKKMAAAISAWLKVRGLSGRVKYKAYSTTGKGKTEAKSKKINKQFGHLLDNERLMNQAGYAVATAIKRKGIKPSYFFSNAIKETQKEQKKRFADAFKLDIIETLSNGS